MSGQELPGRLPDRPVKLELVSGEYPELSESLRKLGIEAIVTEADSRLPEPVRWHPDMQACCICGNMVVLRDGKLSEILLRYGISSIETLELPKPVYPGDVLCNALAWNGLVLGNYRTVDVAVRQAADSQNANWIDVKQGYAACAAALVDEWSAITADMGIARQLESHGVQVLRISPGDIRLPGYDYGFIGGCCGKLAPDVMAFAGRLDRHRDGMRIRDFLDARGIRAVELLDSELLDVGGIIPLR